MAMDGLWKDRGWREEDGGKKMGGRKGN